MKSTVAYFSPEFAFISDMPNYAGGLGVLAADTLFSCADLGINIAGVSLMYHKDDDAKKAFDPSGFMKKRRETVEVGIEDRKVKIGIWQMNIKGKGRHVVPVFFLTSYLPENKPWDRDLTKDLYAGDRYTRLGQEVILGIGGVRALEAMGYKNISRYHLNEGHCALSIFELLSKNSRDAELVRSKTSLTIHTPVESGREYFDYSLFNKTFGETIPPDIKNIAGAEQVDMVRLAINLSGKKNSVSRKHNEICREMFPGVEFENVTNGIYHSRWTGNFMEKLFDESLKGWKNKPEIFENAASLISDGKLTKARDGEKRNFVSWLNKEAGSDFKKDVLTIGFARRFVPYKRPLFIFSDLEKFKKICKEKVQIVFASKCYPDDSFCNGSQEAIYEHEKEIGGEVKIAQIHDYNLDIARRMVSGCDVWLNNPICGYEASGTSGMKAALNGVLNLSILDGWWLEGFERDAHSGLAFGCENQEDMYDKLSDAVECYYGRKEEWTSKMKHSMGLLSFFNTHRLVREYEKKIW